MNRIPMELELAHFPDLFHPILEGAQLFDSSCSSQAQVYYIKKEDGFYLKTAPAGSLKEEAAMAKLFHSLGVGAQVLTFEQLEQDWLLTRAVSGEDCTHDSYRADPKRLSALLGELLRTLHETVLPAGLPNRTADCMEVCKANYRTGEYDKSHFPDNWGYRCAEDAWAVVEQAAPLLRADTLVHGDYCMPNVILDNWKFSGFIDLGQAGVGDRHFDLFWGIWSLEFNLKSSAWKDRFLDAYGRDRIDLDLLNSIGAFEVFR